MLAGQLLPDHIARRRVPPSLTIQLAKCNQSAYGNFHDESY
jgi:hypothetical protein